eukprot:4393308-Alexandrium_andersonii.AAC.1
MPEARWWPGLRPRGSRPPRARAQGMPEPRAGPPPRAAWPEAWALSNRAPRASPRDRNRDRPWGAGSDCPARP